MSAHADDRRRLKRLEEELRERMRYQSIGEAAYIEAIADNRRLRKALTEVVTAIARKDLPRISSETAKMVQGALRQVKAPGPGRPIVSIEFLGIEQRAKILERVNMVLDDYYRQLGEANGEAVNLEQTT